MSILYQPKQISNAEKKIKKQLSSFGIVPRTPVKFLQPNEHSYYSICDDKKGNRYFFKARLWTEKISKISFINEILFYRKYSQNKLFKKQNFLMEIIDSSFGNGLDWALYKSIDGNTLTDVKITPATLNQIAEILIFFSKIPDKQILPQVKNFQKKRLSILLKNYHPNKNIFERYLEETILRFPRDENRLPNHNQIKKIIFENKKALMTAPEIFCHGDFNVSNMMKKKSNEIAVVDWESVQKNNWAYDLANCYTHESFQKYRRFFLKTYLKMLSPKDQKLFLKSFRLMVILQIGYKLFPTLAPKLEKKKESKKMFSLWKKILEEVCNEKI